MGFKAEYHYDYQMHLSFMWHMQRVFFFFLGNRMQRIKWLELKAYGFGLNI